MPVAVKGGRVLLESTTPLDEVSAMHSVEVPAPVRQTASAQEHAIE